MNTTITIKIVLSDNERSNNSTVEVYNAIESAFGEFDRIVKKYTRFNKSSELAHLNRHQQQWYTVSLEFYNLISDMLNLAEKTDGYFDPTIIDFLEAYGYNKDYDFDKLNDPHLARKVKKLAETRAGWNEVQMRRTPHLQVWLASNQRLDLGGIGKGYAIDCAAEKLDRFTNFMIDAGGDIFCQGINKQGNPWQIGLKTKHKQQSITFGTFQHSKSSISLACSGSWARSVGNFHHLINPGTGKPQKQWQTIFVTNPSAKTADGWATALFIGGQSLLENLPENTEALLLDEQGKVLKTPGFNLNFHKTDLSR